MKRGGRRGCSHLVRLRGNYMRTARLLVVNDTAGIEPVLWWFTPNLLSEKSRSLSVAGLVIWTYCHRLEKHGMLVRAPVSNGEAQDTGDDGLAHVRSSAPDLVSAQ